MNSISISAIQIIRASTLQITFKFILKKALHIACAVNNAHLITLIDH